VTQATDLHVTANGLAPGSESKRNAAAPRTVKPSGVHNNLFYWLGGMALVANKLRHQLRGYKTPRPFAVSQTERAAQYDIAVVQQWLEALRRYAGRDLSFRDRTVLELGPGADLGVGLVLLSQGARTYHALDVANLAPQAPPALYDELLDQLDGQVIDYALLWSELDAARAGHGRRLNFVWDPLFDVRAFAGLDIDLVVSQAAFEHFENPGKVIAQLTSVVTPGAILVSEIDLQTHSRWLREADPLNIYRFSDRVYNALRFTGSPNRWRPAEYVDALRRHGWRDIEVTPITVLDDAYVSRVRPSLNPQYRSHQNQMDILHFVICARKA
jgi:SAM-dependent methyltransferase